MATYLLQIWPYKVKHTFSVSFEKLMNFCVRTLQIKEEDIQNQVNNQPAANENKEH